MEEVKVAKKPKTRKSYSFAVGRRKCSIARVRIHKSGEAKIVINEKDYKEYFPELSCWKILEKPLSLTDNLGKLNITIKVRGGGKIGQAGSCSLGIARLLAAESPANRKVLKTEKLLRRDARVKERKKYGLKRARKAPQWAKR
ncbi:MAG: 30S ribosomal protein S9 [Patescibacteria group bacterium]